MRELRGLSRGRREGGTDGAIRATIRTGRGGTPAVPVPLLAVSRRRPMRISKPGDQRRELVDEALQELSGAFIRDGAIGIDEAGLEADIRLPAHDEYAQVPKNLPHMFLRDRRTDGAGRCA